MKELVKRPTETEKEIAEEVTVVENDGQTAIAVEEKLVPWTEGQPMEEEKPKEKKKQATSVTYTLGAFGENIRKLVEAGLILEKEAETLEVLKGEVAKRWVMQKMGMKI